MNSPAADLPLKIALASAREQLRISSAAFIQTFARGDCSVELYSPSVVDPQHPHQQDELYIIARGSGFFRREETVVEFEAGDVLFVPAKAPHRFERFSADFETWVIFFGRGGGSAIENTPSIA